jgi:hypothetical protein
MKPGDGDMTRRELLATAARATMNHGGMPSVPTGSTLRTVSVFRPILMAPEGMGNPRVAHASEGKPLGPSCRATPFISIEIRHAAGASSSRACRYRNKGPDGMLRTAKAACMEACEPVGTAYT